MHILYFVFSDYIWLPLLMTENSGPIWVGRRVDSDTISDIRNKMQMHSALIVAVLILIVLLTKNYS